MAKFQKISLVGNKLTFRVICDDGHEEVQTYSLDGRDEQILMTEVTLHINTERMASVAPVETRETTPGPIMEVSVSKTGRVSIKEAPIEEPVA